MTVKGDIDDIAKIEIMKPTEATQAADLIILFTKAMQLPDMLNDIKPIIKKDIKVLCLLNGLGHEDVIKEHLPKKDIFMGVTIWTAGLEGPGVVDLQGTGAVNLQSIDPSGAKDTINIVDVMNEAKLNVTYDEDVVPSIWRKACANGTMNPTCALLDCTIGEFFATEESKRIVNEIINEFVAVGKASGVDLNKADITDYVMDIGDKVAHHYPSMHQGLIQNKRLTEIDYLNGAVAKKDKELNIETPYCKLITDFIHAKEKILGIK